MFLAYFRVNCYWVGNTLLGCWASDSRSSGSIKDWVKDSGELMAEGLGNMGMLYCYELIKSIRIKILSKAVKFFNFLGELNKPVGKLS